MPHPSDCPLCRIAAEAMGYDFAPGLAIYVNEGTGEEIESFCASLDAIMPLMRELGKEGWSLSYSEIHKKWYVWHPDIEQCFVSEEDDFACVSEAYRDAFAEILETAKREKEAADE